MEKGTEYTVVSVENVVDSIPGVQVEKPNDENDLSATYGHIENRDICQVFQDIAVSETDEIKTIDGTIAGNYVTVSVKNERIGTEDSRIPMICSNNEDSTVFTSIASEVLQEEHDVETPFQSVKNLKPSNYAIYIDDMQLERNQIDESQQQKVNTAITCSNSNVIPKPEIGASRSVSDDQNITSKESWTLMTSEDLKDIVIDASDMPCVGDGESSVANNNNEATGGINIPESLTMPGSDESGCTACAKMKNIVDKAVIVSHGKLLDKALIVSHQSDSDSSSDSSEFDLESFRYDCLDENQPKNSANRISINVTPNEEIEILRENVFSLINDQILLQQTTISDICHEGSNTDGMIHILPIEIMIEIFSYFNICELTVAIAPVCHRWYSLAYHPGLWKNLHMEKLHFQRIDFVTGLCIGLRKTLSVNRFVYHGEPYMSSPEVCVLLENCPRLQELDIGFWNTCQKFHLNFILEKCHHIEKYNLEGCEFIKDACAVLISETKIAKELNFSHCTLEDPGVIALATNLDKITSLNVDGISWITDRYVLEYC